MAQTATQASQTPTTATPPAPAAGTPNDGFRPALTGAAELAGETFRFGGSAVRAASDVVSGPAGPALVLVVAAFAAAGWMRRRR